MYSLFLQFCEVIKTCVKYFLAHTNLEGTADVENTVVILATYFRGDKENL